MTYQNKKPSTKNVLIILLAVLIVGVAFVFAEYRNKEAAIVYENKVESTVPEAETRDDNVDWKKILMANDISSSTKSNDLTKAKEKLTSTDLLGRDFFARYMELRQMGGANDKASQEELVGQVIKNGVTLVSPKLYSQIDIITSNDDSTEAIKKYGNDIGYVFKIFVSNSRNEMVIAKESIDKSNPEILKELDPLIKSYRNILNGLLKTSTPNSLIQTHVDLVNSISSLLFISENLKKINVDPLAGVQAVARYNATFQQLSSTLSAIKTKLNSLNIKYNNGEGGTFLIPN